MQGGIGHGYGWIDNVFIISSFAPENSREQQKPSLEKEPHLQYQCFGWVPAVFFSGVQILLEVRTLLFQIWRKIAPSNRHRRRLHWNSEVATAPEEDVDVDALLKEPRSPGGDKVIFDRTPLLGTSPYIPSKMANFWVDDFTDASVPWMGYSRTVDFVFWLVSKKNVQGKPCIRTVELKENKGSPKGRDLFLTSWLLKESTGQRSGA